MERSSTITNQFLQKVIRIIEENYSNEKFSVEELADKVGLSRSMLHRKLIKTSGKSAIQLITEIRLDRAKKLLEEGDSTASEIAYKVGFSSPSYFFRVFKKQFKVSPGDLKKGFLSHSEIENTIAKKKGHWILYLVITLLIIFISIKIKSILTELPGNSENKSIAILPFKNLSSDEENQYFADGIVEDLLNRLSTLKDIRVISRTSSEAFRHKNEITIPEIARFLGVEYILEGSIQRDDKNILVSVQLIDAKEDNHIFSSQYNKNLTEILKVQSEIAFAIASKLIPILSNEEKSRLEQNPTTNFEAFNYYQIGHLHYCTCTKEDAYTSIDYFKRAIKSDSNYALAYVGIARTYVNISMAGWIDRPKILRDSAIYLAQKALEIDRNLAEAHTVLGTIYYELSLDMETAEAEFHKAIELNQNSAEIYKEYAEFLNFIGKEDEARTYINKATVLAPLTFNIRRISTLLYMDAGNYEDALKENQISLELSKNNPLSLDLEFEIYLGLNDIQAAYESFRKNGPIIGNYTTNEIDSAFTAAGIQGVLQLKIIKTDSRVMRARFYSYLGEIDSAFMELDKAADNGMLRPIELKRIKRGHSTIELDPRYNALKRKLGIENY